MRFCTAADGILFRGRPSRAVLVSAGLSTDPKVVKDNPEIAICDVVSDHLPAEGTQQMTKTIPRHAVTSGSCSMFLGAHFRGTVRATDARSAGEQRKALA
jgi:hypothetical protein